jgi:tetratricopeptide (TPR) repeat protein
MQQLLQSVFELLQLEAESPSNTAIKRNIAGVYSILASTQASQGSLTEAVQSVRMSVETGRQLVRLDPNDARFKITLANSLAKSSGLLLTLGKSADAHDAGAESISIFRRFAERPQATADDYNTYADSLLTAPVSDLRDPRTALAYSLRAVSSVTENNLVFSSTLTDCYLAVGKPGEAMATARRALAANPQPAGSAGAGVRFELERKLLAMQAQQEDASARTR